MVINNILKYSCFTIMILLSIYGAIAADFNPGGNITGRGIYSIYNFTDIKANNIIYESGSTLNSKYNDTLFCSAIVSSVGNWSADKSSYLTATQSNAKFLQNNTCASGYVMQNSTTSGSQCVPITSLSNTTFNQTLTDGLYYGKNSNTLGFYNSSTLPAYPTADNTSWNQTYANTLYVTTSNGTLIYNNLTLYYLKTNPFSFYNSTTIPGYVTTANGTLLYNNLTLYYLASNPLGYFNSTNPPTLNQIGNPTEATVFSMGAQNINWSFNQGAFYIDQIGAFSNELVHIHQHTGNPTAGSKLLQLEAADADVTILNVTGNRDVIATFNGNITIRGSKVCTADGINCPAGSGDNTSWNESYANTLYWKNNSPSLRINGTLSNFTVPALYIHQNYTNSTNQYRTLVVNISSSGASYFNSFPIAVYKDNTLIAGISGVGALYGQSLGLTTAYIDTFSPNAAEYITFKDVNAYPSMYIYSSSTPTDNVHLNISTGTTSNDVFLQSQGETNSGLRLITSGTGKTNVSGTLVAANITLQSNCADGQIIKWNGGVGKCGTDETTAGGGDGTGGWTNTTVKTDTNLQVNINDTTNNNYLLNVYGNKNGSIEASITNTNTSSDASTNLCFYNTVNKETEYNCIGTNGVAYSSVNYTSQSPGDFYLESKSKDIHIDVLNSSKAIEFYVGGAAPSNLKMSIDSTGVNLTSVNGAPVRGPLRSTNYFFTDFMVSGAQQTDFGAAAISSGTTADVAMGTDEENHPGIASISDSTTANGGYRYYSAVGGIVLNNGTGGEIIFKAGAASTVNWTIIMGFHDTTTSALPVDGCFFYTMNNNGNYQARCRSNNVETNSTTNVTIISTTPPFYRARIDVINSTLVTFSVYNSTVTVQNKVWESNITTNIPFTQARATGFGVIGTQSTTAAAQVLLNLDAMAWWHNNTIIR